MKPRHYRLYAVMTSTLCVSACGPVSEAELNEIGEAITIDTAATYTMVGVGSNKCLQIQGSSTADLAPLQIATCNSANSGQRFRMESAGSGFYAIRNIGSSLPSVESPNRASRRTGTIRDSHVSSLPFRIRFRAPQLHHQSVIGS